MDKVFEFDKATDMITLAQEIQVNVYWGKAFYDENEECIGYNAFWELCDEAYSNGYKKVKITKDDDVIFIR